MSLKEKTISGLTWSFIDNFANQSLLFIVSIILARLLTPREFGLIGMTTFFIAISRAFIDSGFTKALIRKNSCTQIDFSTVFYFNLVFGVFFYFILFFSAGVIGRFFNEPQLKLIIQVLGLGLIINSFTIIQRARLIKRIDFKLQTKISVLAVTGSGIIGVTMAYFGYGVWSLIMQSLAGAAFSSLLLWYWNRWKPSFAFSWDSFKEMFSFGSKLLASSLLNTIYHNIYLLVIGKYFSAADLGFYTRADAFKKLPSENLNRVISQVSYPVLSTIQNDLPQLKSVYQKLIKSTMLITFIAMMGLAAVAEPLILTLIGEQWMPSVVYLQLLCFVGMLYPLHAINLNMLNVQGRSDLFLRLEIIKKIMAIPVIIIGILYGIKIMIIGMIINSVIAYILNSYYSGRHIGYSSLMQAKDILPSFMLAFIVGGSVFIVGLFLKTPVIVSLIAQIFVGAILTIVAVELLKIDSYLIIKQTVVERYFSKNDRNSTKII